MRPHAAAAKVLLETATGVTVYDGFVPSVPADRYVVFYLTTPAGVEKSRRLSTATPKLRFMLSTLCVGLTPAEVRWVIEKVHAALIGKRLVVAGRICDPFVPPRSGAQVRPDESLTPSAWVATDVWPFNSTLKSA